MVKNNNMKRQINFFTSTLIWLHLEDYYNAGITSLEAKKIIENLRDFNNTYIICENSGINGNWIVGTSSNNKNDHLTLVKEIQWALESFLASPRESEELH